MQAETLPPLPLTMEQQKVAMADPDHLLRWMRSTNRQFVIFEVEDLIRSQIWPQGIDLLMAIIASYRDHRAAIPTGETTRRPGPGGEQLEVPVYKGEQLEVDEMERCVRWLIAQIVERCPNWSLESSAA